MAVRVNSGCAYCDKAIAGDEYVAACSDCGTVLHEQCWLSNGRCTTLGCTGHAKAVVRASVLVEASGAVRAREHQQVGKNCPFCQTPIKPGAPMHVCEACGIPHHAECWEHNGGCTTFGCSGMAARQRNQSDSRSANGREAEQSQPVMLMDLEGSDYASKASTGAVVAVNAVFGLAVGLLFSTSTAGVVTCVCVGILVGVVIAGALRDAK